MAAAPAAARSPPPTPKSGADADAGLGRPRRSQRALLKLRDCGEWNPLGGCWTLCRGLIPPPAGWSLHSPQSFSDFRWLRCARIGMRFVLEPPGCWFGLRRSIGFIFSPLPSTSSPELSTLLAEVATLSRSPFLA
eukprot:gene10200-238_t